MPYVNYHACRIKQPSGKETRYARDEREHDGKKYDVIYQENEEGSWEDQAYRYKKDVWTAESAESHCDSHDGSFEPASEETKDSIDGTDVSEFLIYGDIGDSFGGGITAQDVHSFLEVNRGHIRLRINSSGGDCFEGLVIYNLLASSKRRIDIIIDALCASAATIITLAGSNIQIANYGFYVIHDPWTCAVGCADDFAKVVDRLRSLSNSLVDLYAERSGAEKSRIRSWLQEEKWFPADEAKRYGFVDEVITPKQVVSAHIDPTRFKNVPRELSQFVVDKPRQAAWRLEAAKHTLSLLGEQR